MSAKMRACIYDPRGQDGLRLDDSYPAPKPGPGEVLIEVHAVGFNPVDFKIPDAPGLGYMRRGRPGGSCLFTHF
jgi:NADPH:quinone reductase-like Zn-dependent oxidoreductase